MNENKLLAFSTAADRKRNSTEAWQGSSTPSHNEDQAIWERIKEKLRARVGEDHYGSWFKGLAFEGIVDGIAHLSVSTLFLRQWIQNHYGDLVLDLVQEEIDDVQSLSLSVRGTVRHRERPGSRNDVKLRTLPAPSQDLNFDSAQPRRTCDTESPFGGAPLDPKYTFQSFCIGQGNHVAFKAMKAMATGDRSVHFSSLFIHAKVGLGKTHLLQAIAWENLRGPAARRVLYLTSERFMQKLRDGFANKTISEIKERMRDVDVMLIDDVQFLNGEKFLEEFSHLVNALIDSGKQVVVTADRPVAELKNLDQRVLSRLRGGVAFSLEGPDRDLRRKILMSRLSALTAADPTIALPDTVIEYIVQAITTNGRDLECDINRLVAQQRHE
ncbi:MAG: DnaA/Hda family protein [Pseudomonadota bacterium]